MKSIYKLIYIFKIQMSRVNIHLGLQLFNNYTTMFKMHNNVYIDFG